MGGGGGGSMAGGLEVLENALKAGTVELKGIETVNDPEGVLVTASLVGSPASPDKYVANDHYIKVYDIFKRNDQADIAGIITNEMGAQSSLNGWILSAMTGIPLIDAPCNGRAHPTGTMGSMGLTMQPDYVSVQAAAGGKGARNVEVFTQGTLDNASKVIRTAAALAGGYVTVLRNPVTAAYAAQNGAVGALSQSMELGAIIDECQGNCPLLLEKLAEKIDLTVLATGVVEAFALEIKNGFDIGMAKLKAKDGGDYYVDFWNEYMTVEKDSERLATFPDLITFIDLETAMPIISAELGKGREAALVKIPRSKLALGGGMRDKQLFYEVEQVIGKGMVDYVF